MSDSYFCTCPKSAATWCVQCGGDYPGWPAALAERLERAARELQNDIDSADGWVKGELGASDYDKSLSAAFDAVDAARARGEIPPRTETA